MVRVEYTIKQTNGTVYAQKADIRPRTLCSKWHVLPSLSSIALSSIHMLELKAKMARYQRRTASAPMFLSIPSYTKKATALVGNARNKLVPRPRVNPSRPPEE